MILQLQWNEVEYQADLSRGADLSIPLKEGAAGVNCFWAPFVEYWPVAAGDFVGSTRQGGVVNFFNLKCNPHGNGTHTECVGHIAREPYLLNDCLKTSLHPALLVSVFPEKQDDGDRVVTLAGLLAAVQGAAVPPALILRTLPNHPDKQRMHYSGTNPVYLDPAAAAWMADQGVEHLLLDLPSVDREEDGGLLLAHRAFWRYPEAPRTECTISELLFIPDGVPDGLYLLDIQTAPFELDASPSRPVVFPLHKKV